MIEDASQVSPMDARASQQEQGGKNRSSVCFVGCARHSQPLTAEQAKKYRELSPLGEIFVVGFSTDVIPRRFTQDAHFYLIPNALSRAIRYVVMCSMGVFIVGFLVFRRGVRIIVTQSPYEGIVAVWVKLLAGLAGKRIAVVIESHGDFEIDLFMQRRIRFASLHRFLIGRIAGFTLRHADVLRAISSSTRHQLQAHAPGKPLVEFPAWTDIEAFLGAQRTDYDDVFILYVGVLIRRKGVHVLLEAFERLANDFPEAKLLIIGEAADREYARSLKKQSACGKAGDRIVFLNPVSQKELGKYMASARVFVLPSLSEGLGRVVFEAMACGTPVIGTRVGGIPDLIEDGVSGFLFEPNDTDNLIKHLRWALEHPEECSTMGQRARLFAREFFSSERYRKSYAELFQLASDVINANAPGA